MEYKIKRIQKKEEICSCEPFEVQHFLWVKGPTPRTWGYMGYLEGKGLYIQMNCQEQNPRRVCSGEQGRFSEVKGQRICDDSAMEIFIGFPEADGSLTADSMYVNFELNANGIMFASYGKGRKNRVLLDEKTYKQAMPTAKIGEKSWSVEVLMPEEFMNCICSENNWKKRGISCNFYKISETREIEHYGCFAKIQSKTPDFHRPQDFAVCILEE